MKFEKLPLEIIHKIFSFLDCSGMKAVLLCCSFWSKIGKNPKFWSSFTMVGKNHSDLVDAMNLARYQEITKLRLSVSWLSDTRSKFLPVLAERMMEIILPFSLPYSEIEHQEKVFHIIDRLNESSSRVRILDINYKLLKWEDLGRDLGRVLDEYEGGEIIFEWSEIVEVNWVDE